MADCYLELVEKASLTEMATTWKINSRLDGIFGAKAFDISEFQNVGKHFWKAKKDEVRHLPVDWRYSLGSLLQMCVFV